MENNKIENSKLKRKTKTDFLIDALEVNSIIPNNSILEKSTIQNLDIEKLISFFYDHFENKIEIDDIKNLIKNDDSFLPKLEKVLSSDAWKSCSSDSSEENTKEKKEQKNNLPDFTQFQNLLSFYSIIIPFLVQIQRVAANGPTPVATPVATPSLV